MELIIFLINNVDLFTWSPYEALGVDREFLCHRLNMDPNHPPKKQKPCMSSDMHSEVVKKEVDKLKEAGAIKEVFVRINALKSYCMMLCTLLYMTLCMT